MAKSNKTARHESSIDTETNTDDRHHQNSKLGCHKMILVGTGRRTSLGKHTGKSKCRQAVKRKQQAKGLRTLFDVGLAHCVAGPVPHPPKMHNAPKLARNRFTVKYRSHNCWILFEPNRIQLSWIPEAGVLWGGIHTMRMTKSSTEGTETRRLGLPEELHRFRNPDIVPVEISVLSQPT